MKIMVLLPSLKVLNLLSKFLRILIHIGLVYAKVMYGHGITAMYYRMGLMMMMNLTRA